MIRRHSTMTCTLALLIFCTASELCPAQMLEIRGETVYTMAGPPIKDGYVLISGGKIRAVGRADEKREHPEGLKVLWAKVVTPGLIDAHATVGLTGYLNQAQDQDQLEHSDAIQPELRAIDAYNPGERLIDWVRSLELGRASCRDRV